MTNKRTTTEGKIVLSRKVFFLMILGFFVSLGLSATFGYTVSAKENSPSDDYSALQLFTNVISLVQKNYVEEVDLSKLVEGAVKGMLQTLDPHSSYLDPETYKELQVETKGEFGGLGIEITIKDGLLTVVSPIEGSPAARAGVQSGDQIIKIGDEFAKNLSLVDAVKKMRGPKGTPIVIAVHRQGYKELLPITVIRDIIKVNSVRSRMLDERFGYIRLSQFQEDSTKDFEAALKSLEAKAKNKELAGLVMDLRNNPGGLLNQAVRIADIFLKDGIIVYTDGRLESQKQRYFASDDGTEPSFPLIVLVNGGSASASEIVSGAFQDSGRAVILGTQTFGKGSVQTILPMDNGAALRLTTSLYFTRSGRSIQAQGITPDVIVSARRYPSDSEELLEDDESGLGPIKEKDLPGVIKNPHEKDKPAPATKPDAPGADLKTKKQGAEKAPMTPAEFLAADLGTLLKEDPQLEEAYKLLKTWNVFKGKPAPQPTADAAPAPAQS